MRSTKLYVPLKKNNMSNFVCRLISFFALSFAIVSVRGETVKKVNVGEMTPYALGVAFHVVDSQTNEPLEKVEFHIQSVSSPKIIRLGTGPELVPEDDKYYFQIRDPKPGEKWILKFRDVKPEEYKDDRREKFQKILERQGRYKDLCIEFTVPEFDKCEQSFWTLEGKDVVSLHIDIPDIKMDKLVP